MPDDSRTIRERAHHRHGEGDTLVIDKTGTLTEGRPKVVHIEPATGVSANDVLQKLASVERASEHPLAMAIVTDAQDRKLPLAPVKDFDSPVGKGVMGTVEEQAVVSGSAKFLAGGDLLGIVGQDALARDDAATSARTCS